MFLFGYLISIQVYRFSLPTLHTTWALVHNWIYDFISPEISKVWLRSHLRNLKPRIIRQKLSCEHLILKLSSFRLCLRREQVCFPFHSNCHTHTMIVNRASLDNSSLVISETSAVDVNWNIVWKPKLSPLFCFCHITVCRRVQRMWEVRASVCAEVLLSDMPQPVDENRNINHHLLNLIHGHAGEGENFHNFACRMFLYICVIAIFANTN